MSVFGKKSPAAEADAVDEVDEQVHEEAEFRAAVAAGRMPGKGRPTPKRRESQPQRGPVAPPPRSQREAGKRQKTERTKLSKDERRALGAQRRERMMRGEDAYLMARDKGAVRAYVRDVVDSRRNLAGLLLPIALLSIITMGIPSPAINIYGPPILMVLILAGVVDSYVVGRRLSRRVKEKFPKGDKSGQSTRPGALGFYAFNRSVLIRRWRVPRPRVDRGSPVE